MQHSARQIIDEAFRLRRLDVSLAHSVILAELVAEPGITGAELARRGFVTAQSMNTILRRLEEEGAIERRPNPANQRADSWFITKLGQTRFDRARVVAKSVWRGAFESFKDHEIVQLQNLLQRCLTGLEGQRAKLRNSRSGTTSASRKRPRKEAVRR
jgi:DNA-binding MarR family transcriptional regulator